MSTTITLPSSLSQAYGDVLHAPGHPASSLPVDHKELTADHLNDLRHAALLDIANIEGVIGINGWWGHTADEIDSEDPGAVLCLREDCMAARRLLRWTENQLKQEES